VIVREPPYDLVALFADDDARRFFEQVIERGQERGCLRQIRWASVPDPMHDSLFHHPDRELRPFLTAASFSRFLLVGDQDGSGLLSAEAEHLAASALLKYSIPQESILVVAIAPELEAILATGDFTRCKELLAEKRKLAPPTDAQVLERARTEIRRMPTGRQLPADLPSALLSHPKEILKATAHLLKFPYTPVLFSDIFGKLLSLQRLKSNSAFARITSSLAAWFPPVGRS